jgi:K+-transporting ATPase ATPase C chain
MKHIRTGIAVLLFWTLVTGGIYPLIVTGIGSLFFRQKAGGSLVLMDGNVVGSKLIGQDFKSDRFFHPRPSAVKYDPSASGASNLGYTSKALRDAFEERKAAWRRENGATEAPLDMLFASGSGLDPHTSPEAAERQVGRIAAARRVSDKDVPRLLALVKRFDEGPQFGFLGEPRVNVLLLNIALDREFPR